MKTYLAGSRTRPESSPTRRGTFAPGRGGTPQGTIDSRFRRSQRFPPGETRIGVGDIPAVQRLSPAPQGGRLAAVTGVAGPAQDGQGLALGAPRRHSGAMLCCQVVRRMRWHLVPGAPVAMLCLPCPDCGCTTSPLGACPATLGGHGARLAALPFCSMPCAPCSPCGDLWTVVDCADCWGSTHDAPFDVCSALSVIGWIFSSSRTNPGHRGYEGALHSR